MRPCCVLVGDADIRQQHQTAQVRVLVILRLHAAVSLIQRRRVKLYCYSVLCPIQEGDEACGLLLLEAFIFQTDGE